MNLTNTASFWNKNQTKVFDDLDTSQKGLTDEDAKKRILKYGPNVVGNQKPRSPITILMGQLKNWLILMLLGASLISFYLGEGIDGIVIIVMVILSVLFGFFQEFKAEKIISDLKKFISNKARVLRNEKWISVDSKDLVPGDVVEIRIGDKVPADIRLLSVDNLAIDESTLTGESVPILKISEAIKETSENPSKRTNMAFMGTLVAEGRGKGVVVATARDTFFGKSAKSLETPESETDFQKQIKNFSFFLFKVVMIMTLFIFAVNTALKKDVLDSFLFALALAVGVTPEMLPAIITVTLSQGAMKMAKKKVIVKRLISVEDFGNVDTLCMDKTGTITEGKFVLDSFLNLNEHIDENVLVNAALCTSGLYEKTQEVLASPIDKAILTSGFTKNLKKKLDSYSLVDENVFDYKRKRMSVLVKERTGLTLIAKGAPESILEISTDSFINGKKTKIDEKIHGQIKELIDKYEAKSYRIIAVSQKSFRETSSKMSDETEMTLMGFLFFKDPMKDSSKEAIKKFEELGVSLKVLSGDSVAVTVNIAREAGLLFSDNEVMSGEDLEKISESDLREVCKKVKIFARVTPEQKYVIVRTLNYEDHIVGFMGDGVNDVPAIRAADVGISVDGAVDIAKDAADIILLEKDLKILSEGIEGGRKTFGNIMKYILNTISANYGNMFTVAISSTFINFIPLLPSQILLNNFISDVPMLAVATDNVDRGFVKKPKRWNLEYIKSFMINYGFVSSFFDMMLILPMIFILKVSPEVFRTAWFVESSISEILVTFTIRTKLPFYKSAPSRWLLWLSVGSILLVTSMPFIKWGAFKFTSLPLAVWGLIAVDLVCYFAVTEIVKKGFFKKFEAKTS